LIAAVCRLLLLLVVVVTAELLLDPLWGTLAGVVLVVLSVVLVVHLLGILLGLVLGLLAVDVVHTLGLSELVDLGTSESGKELFGELVRDRLACLACQQCFIVRGSVVLALAALVVLECLEGSEGGTASNNLVAQAGLIVVIVALLVSVVRFT